MAEAEYQNLSKRERQIMNILHQLNEGSVQEVVDGLLDPSGYNSIRMLMNILVKKGHLQHRKEKKKYIYYPTLRKEIAKKSALDHIMTTYFEKSVPKVVSTLLSNKDLSASDLDELSQLIEAAKQKKATK